MILRYLSNIHFLWFCCWWLLFSNTYRSRWCFWGLTSVNSYRTRIALTGIISVSFWFVLRFLLGQRWLSAWDTFGFWRGFHIVIDSQGREILPSWWQNLIVSLQIWTLTPILRSRVLNISHIMLMINQEIWLLLINQYFIVIRNTTYSVASNTEYRFCILLLRIYVQEIFTCFKRVILGLLHI